MAVVRVNGTTISYTDQGTGDPVVLVMGTGSPGHVWHLHQVPALLAAGYRVITFDNRGLAPGGGPPPEIDDLVADLAGLIETLCGGRCRVAGVSMGAHVVQELLLARPELVDRAVLLATRGRPDHFRTRLADAEAQLYFSDAELPAAYAAALRAVLSLSPHTLNDEGEARKWLDLFEVFPTGKSVMRAQHRLEVITERLEAYRGIRTRCLVVAFEDDLITPPHLCQEVAMAIPGCRYEQVAKCGHYGYLEQPDEVNSLILDFFGS
ncbi:alpha/beta fold hydrolase [Acrocarpospora catenulata]|uniref:alpha/beta fold hydrolase n=1 Tax=Acrocarpospora catenulata TaxID=2836182 RepID=UPI001BD9CF33|nr:alpha/beta hydrolase [Acrocarpospora catenulata]